MTVRTVIRNEHVTVISMNQELSFGASVYSFESSRFLAPMGYQWSVLLASSVCLLSAY